MDGYVSRDEAAKLAGVHFNTIRLWEKTGRLTPRRVQRGSRTYVRVSLKELNEIVEDRGDKASQLPGGTHDQVTELRERVARLEAEKDSLTTRLEELRSEREELLHHVLDTKREDAR